MIVSSFKDGLKDGVAIGIGYLSVSFTFGMMAVAMGIPVEVATIISFTNLTSAGQFAALDIMVLHGAYIEMALTQCIINLRYALMSLSLSQKIDQRLKTGSRALMAFAITDEIYALSMSKEGKIGKQYFIGLACMPILGWGLGTLIGASAGQLLPGEIRDILSLAIYGMFLAIIIPPAKKSSVIRKVVLLSAGISCFLALISNYITIGSGFVIIICTIISAGIMAFLHPIREAEV